jgi:hypothetical protein
MAAFLYTSSLYKSKLDVEYAEFLRALVSSVSSEDFMINVQCGAYFTSDRTEMYPRDVNLFSNSKSLIFISYNLLYIIS